MSSAKIGLSEKSECIRLALAAGKTQKEAEQACSTCSDSKPLYDVAVKSANTASKLGTIPLGVRTNPDDDPIEVAKLFIEDRVALGDTLEDARQKSIGIKRFCYDDADGWHTYYSHDAQGAIEYDRFNASAKPVETAEEKTCRKVLDLRRVFGDSEEEAYSHTAYIIYPQQVAECKELQTPIASKLLNQIANGADDFKLIETMAQWQLAHKEAEEKQLNEKQQRNHDYRDSNMTVGNLYGRTQEQVAADQHPTFNEFEKEQEAKGVHMIRNEHSLPTGNRFTVGDLYGKTRKQILDEAQKKE